MSDLVSFEQDADVGRVTFRRPEVGNQVNVATMRALIDALERADDADIDVLVLQGEGEVFCVGRDQTEDPRTSPTARISRSSSTRTNCGIISTASPSRQ